MKKLFVVFAGILFLFSSCKNNELPSDVLPQEKMLPIMVDIHIAEQVLQAQELNFDSSRVLFHSVYKAEILKKHGVELAHFDSSLVYYERDVEAIDKLYQQVVDTLALRYSLKKLK